MRGACEDVSPRAGADGKVDSGDARVQMRALAQLIANEHGEEIAWGPADCVGPYVCVKCGWAVMHRKAHDAHVSKRLSLAAIVPECGNPKMHRVRLTEREAMEESIRKMNENIDGHRWRLGLYTASCARCGYTITKSVKDEAELCKGSLTHRGAGSSTDKLLLQFTSLDDMDEWMRRRNPERSRRETARPKVGAKRTGKAKFREPGRPLASLHPVDQTSRVNGVLTCGSCGKKARGASKAIDRKFWWEGLCTGPSNATLATNQESEGAKTQDPASQQGRSQAQNQRALKSKQPSRHEARREQASRRRTSAAKGKGKQRGQKQHSGQGHGQKS